MTEHTLAAARSPLKILNHTDQIFERDVIEAKLGLHRSTDAWMLGRNQETLSRFVAISRYFRGTPADTAIQVLAERAYMASVDVAHMLRNYAQAAQVEFHPSDICNEACRGCTYGHDEASRKPAAVCYPFDRLDELAKLAPRAMTIVGGGEPLLYRDGERNFADLMLRLRELLPECRFGLITNGTLLPVPSEKWLPLFDWIRFSVDAAYPATYAKVRGRDLFHLMLRNLLRVLNESDVPQVNVGFVFSRDNIDEAPDAARFFYDTVRENAPEHIGRLNIEYRPLRRDSKDEGRADFPEAVTPEQIDLARALFLEMGRRDEEFRWFLAARTNHEIIGLGNAHVPVAFQHCGFSGVFRLVRADGEIRPCCMRLFDPEFYIGNLLTDPLETIALNLIHNATFLKPGCDAAGCKLGQYNDLTERAVDGTVQQSEVGAIRDNPFFG